MGATLLSSPETPKSAEDHADRCLDMNKKYKYLHLYLVRHGETAWNIEKRLQGSLEPGPGLTAKGKQQARSVGIEYTFDAVYTSPLLRCIQSVEEIVGDGQIQPKKVEELKERSLGVYEGRLLDREVLQHIRRGVGVETFEDLKARSRKALESIARDAIRCGHANIMVVTHGGFSSACCSWIAPNEKLSSMANCGVSKVRISYNSHGYLGWEVEEWNAVGHLQDSVLQSDNFGGKDFG